MELSTEIYEALDLAKIPHNMGIPYILMLKFKIRSSPLFQEEFVKKMNQTGIYDIGKNNSLIWLVPVFKSEVERDFGWVEKYVDMFARANPDRKGNVNTCILRFKDFFFKNPDVTKQEVQKATALYFKSLSDPQYLVTSYYFIYKGKGKEKISLLMEYIEKVREMESLGEGRSSLSNTMQ